MTEERRSDEHTAVILHRLTTLENRVDNGFATLNKTIIDTSLSFVRLDVYLAQRESDKADVESLKRLAQWSIGLVASAAISAIVVGTVSMSGAFQ